MSAILFDRVARVEVETLEGDSLVIQNNRVMFDVTMTRTSTANTAVVQIYNLSESTRSRLKDRNAKISLYAGYSFDTGAQLLYTGSAQHIISEISPPDVVTRLECYDTLDKLRETRAVLSYGDRTPLRNVLETIAKQYAVPIKIILQTEETFPSGYAFYGLLRDALDEIARRFSLEWSFQNGELVILPIGGVADVNPIKIDGVSGLVNSPETINYQYGELNGFADENQPEWRIKSLLRPKVVPASKVQIASKTANGIFVVDNVTHSGDTRGGDWLTTMEVLSE